MSPLLLRAFPPTGFNACHRSRTRPAPLAARRALRAAEHRKTPQKQASLFLRRFFCVLVVRELSWRPRTIWRKQVWFPKQVDSPVEGQETKSPGAALKTAEVLNISLLPVIFLFFGILFQSEIHMKNPRQETAHPKPSPLEKVPSAAKRMWSPAGGNANKHIQPPPCAVILTPAGGSLAPANGRKDLPPQAHTPTDTGGARPHPFRPQGDSSHGPSV